MSIRTALGVIAGGTIAAAAAVNAAQAKTEAEALGNAAAGIVGGAAVATVVIASKPQSDS